jgi:hypothetical protein
MNHLKNRKDPDNTKGTGADERNDHWQDAAPQSTDRAAQGIHNSAQKIRNADIAHANQAIANGGRIRCVNAEEIMAGEIKSATQSQADYSNDKETF